MSRLYIIIISFIVVTFISTVSMAAKSLPPEELPDLIQQRYETLKTFQADFIQELTNVASGEVDTREGRIYFKQPSQVRWVTEQPEKELLVVGAEYAWNYIEDEQLAIKYGVVSLLDSKTIIRFISGQANLKEDFIVKTEWQGADEVRAKWGKGFTVLQLVPKEAEPGMVLAYIGVEPDTGLLRQVMIVDFYGNGNELRLYKVEIDINLPSEMFEFIPPEGTQVEDNTGGY